MTAIKMSPLQQLPSELIILIFEAILGHVTSFRAIYAIWLSSRCLYYRFSREFIMDLFLQHLQFALSGSGMDTKRRHQRERILVEGLFRLVVDACQKDTPEFLQRATIRYPRLFLIAYEHFKLRIHTNHIPQGRGSFYPVPSMLDSIRFGEYAILMDAPLTARLLLSRRDSLYPPPNGTPPGPEWRVSCQSYFLRHLISAILATEDVNKEQVDAALLAARRFGLPRTADLVSVDPGSGPAAGPECGGNSGRSEPPGPARNRLLRQPREVAAREVASRLLQAMKLNRDFTLYHSGLPVALRRSLSTLHISSNPDKFMTPLTQRWIDLTTHRRLTGPPDDVSSIEDSSLSPGSDLANSEPWPAIDSPVKSHSSARASVLVCTFPCEEEKRSNETSAATRNRQETREPPSTANV
ncbi:hypothetical protein QBC40DRAFT_290048 [Triangularia verruculosa]|uniref:Uncharacterized protein n=1 Tax=Triangularia verruculosa TaxID=2587418 RepID=A0AAN6X650_9PEZI|nr:hypothetical protein QBC40DRAFT_290048 [Triangularia verruculosa]